MLTARRYRNTSLSFLATPDNRIRSFYVKRDNFHLLTNCEAIAHAFIDLASTQNALADDLGFLQARQRLAHDRGDTVFAFLSRQFMQGMISPAYRIETARRLRAATEIQLLHLSRLAAAQESRAAWQALPDATARAAAATQLPAPLGPAANQSDSNKPLSNAGPPAEISQLVGMGLLPHRFGQRPDGSHPVDHNDQVVDSLRGRRGYFLPVPDVPLTQVTTQEQETFTAVARFHQQHWTNFDPLAVSLKRRPADDPQETNREILELDAYMSPLDRVKYDRWLTVLGSPTQTTVVHRPEDFLSVEAVVQGGPLVPSAKDHHLVLGLRDVAELPEIEPGRLLGKLEMMRAAPAYVIAWPELGLLRLLQINALSRDEGQGYARLPFQLWRRDCDDYAAISFHRGLLAELPPQINRDSSDQWAQLRLRCGDISESAIATWVDAVMADRGLRASLGNARFMHALVQQLGVAPEQSRHVAEQLLDAQLVCSLGGDYVWQQAPGRWQSSAWSSTWPLQLADPAKYQAPLTQWLDGLRLTAALHEDVAEVHATVTIHRVGPVAADAAPKPSLFKLFQGG
ncbi:MAG: hypothetical protein KDA60_07790 [Planctomycetales bacterium]|nr:hypothetical protein [Planctomycetales bacterium]